MIYTLTIDCVYGAHFRKPCRRVIEIDEDDTLYGLHLAIQKSVSFDNDHLFEFYAARTVRSRPRYPIGAEAVEMAFGGIPSKRNFSREMAWVAGFRADSPTHTRKVISDSLD